MSLMRAHPYGIDAWWDSSQVIRCRIMQPILLHFEYGRIMVLGVSQRHNKVSWSLVLKVRMMLTQLWKRNHGCLRRDLLFSNCGTHTLFLTKTKSQKCQYRFTFRDYLSPFGLWRTVLVAPDLIMQEFEWNWMLRYLWFMFFNFGVGYL